MDVTSRDPDRPGFRTMIALVMAGAGHDDEAISVLIGHATRDELAAVVLEYTRWLAYGMTSDGFPRDIAVELPAASANHQAKHERRTPRRDRTRGGHSRR